MMSLQPAKLLVSVGEHAVCVKIAGRANFSCGPDFKTLVTELHQKGYQRFVIDMSECMLMDSTFLGLLCGLGLKLSNGGTTESGVELLNPTPRVQDLLESLGVCEVVKIVHGTPCAPVETVTRTGETHSREDMARTSLEAHEILMSLSPENAARFKDVAQFLAEDLKRIKGEADAIPEPVSPPTAGQ